MIKKITPIFLIGETPLHPGSGSELGIVDLPIQRERHTHFPKIEGSGIKGCVREAFESLREFKNGKSVMIKCKQTEELKKNFPDIEEVWNENGKEKKDKGGNILSKYEQAIYLTFGPEKGEEHAGSLIFTDARILLFPVKSLKGIFAWITCPMVLERFKEDMRIAGKDLKFSIKENSVPQDSHLVISSEVVLEEYTFKVNKKDEETSKIAELLSEAIFPEGEEYNYWREKMKKDIVILKNEDFKSFVTTSTEVIARTKIKSETGTVERGALWYEEYLPQDTILYTLAMATPVRVEDESKKGIFKGDTPEEEAEKILKFLKAGLPSVFQIGGNQTIGKGFVRVKIWED